jgi:hypothetical protein
LKESPELADIPFAFMTADASSPDLRLQALPRKLFCFDARAEHCPALGSPSNARIEKSDVASIRIPKYLHV